MTETASPGQLLDLSTSLAQLVARAAPSIVAVRSHRARSSGFVWRPGLIATADEALAEEGEIAVRPAGGGVIQARLVGSDSSTDIALLRVDRADLTPMPNAVSQVAVGALAVAVGTHEGSPSAAFGIVSRATGSWRSLRGGEITARIELDKRMRRSAEGGLALDAAGQVIGMAVFGPRRRVLVIPTATIDRVASRLETHGRIARGYLGLGLHPVKVEGSNEAGALVMSVDAQGPGSAAGVRQGDILLALNGEPLSHIRRRHRLVVGEPVEGCELGAACWPGLFHHGGSAGWWPLATTPTAVQSHTPSSLPQTLVLQHYR